MKPFSKIPALFVLLFVMFSVSRSMADPTSAPTVDTSVTKDCPNLIVRNLNNSKIIFEQTHKGNVAFIGGSITEREGYRPLVCAELKKRFPGTDFTFTNAGVSSTASITGAFRLQNDVLSHGPIDLLFVEFAVNDDQDAHYSQAECIRGMEGIIRHALLSNPNMDIVVTYFVNGDMLATFKKGGDPLSSSSHQLVLDHYGISTVKLNKELADRIAADTMTWEEYGGVHPGPIGNQFGANMITALLDKAWSNPPANSAVTPHKLPEPLDPHSYFNGHFVDVDEAKIENGWTVEIPDWKAIGGSFRQNFAGRKFISATEPGSKLSLSFTGTAVGIYLLAGPDAGMVQASIDGGQPQKFDLFAGPSPSLHYPRSIVFNGDLSPGPHTLELQVMPDKNARSKGTAARIMEFCVN